MMLSAEINLQNSIEYKYAPPFILLYYLEVGLLI